MDGETYECVGICETDGQGNVVKLERECLYQGMAGDMIIRFLFDYKNRKIVTAYPVMEGETKISGRDMPDCYDKYLRYCDRDFREGIE